MENNEKNNVEKENNNKEKSNKIRTRVWIVLMILILAMIGYIVYAVMEQNSTNNIGVEQLNKSNSIDSTRNIIKDSKDNCENIDSRMYVVDPSPIITAYKPVIYLYPEKETQLTVKLGKKENITCSYPQYKDGWNVIAKPDGTLIDTETGRKLYSLYWEGIDYEKPDTTEGFVVKGSDTIKFLEEKLSILGLNEIEAEEFIIYWLPKMQNNKYNYIRFATMDEINRNMPLEFSTKPDTVIRILMQYKALDSKIEVKEQQLSTPERKGFTAVEWGGTELDK